MSNIVENLFSAVDIQIDSKLRQTDYARTIIGTVIGCIDPEQRIYKINYQDTIFEAQAPTGEYDKDEKVKILTTNVEDESLKVIVGRTSVSDLTTLKESSLYTSLGSSIVEDNEEDDIVEYTLSGSQTILYEKGESNNLLKVNETLLEKHLKESMMFSIGAEVLAELNSNPVNLVFELSYKGQLVKPDVKIEITQNSFDFKSYQSYFKDCEFDTIESIYLEKINELTESEVLKIKNITFNIVKENESANRMQAVIHGYEGDTLHDKIEQITIEARMMQGATFIDPDLCSFQWYIEDPWEESGWKKLEGARWQRPIVQLTSEDVYYSPMRYKAEITYGEMIFEASTLLKNLAPEYGSRSITINGNDTDYSIQLIANQDKSELYKWEHIDVYRQQETVSQDSSINTLSVNRNSNYNQYTCYFRTGNKYIGSASIVIDNSKLIDFYEESVKFAFSDNEEYAPYNGLWAPRIGEISNIDKPILWKRVVKGEEYENINKSIDVISCKNKNIAHIIHRVEDGTHWIWKVYYSNGFIGNAKVMMQGSSELIKYYLCKKNEEGEVDYTSKKEATLTSDVSVEYPYLIAYYQDSEYCTIAKYGTAAYQGVDSLKLYYLGNSNPPKVEESVVVFGKTENPYTWAKEVPSYNTNYRNRYRAECPYNKLGKLHYDETIEDWNEPIPDGNYVEDGPQGPMGPQGEPAVDFNLKSSTSYFKADSKGITIPDKITFWVEGSNLPDGSTWKIWKDGEQLLAIDISIEHTYEYPIVSTDLNQDSLTFTASLGDDSLTDATTIIKLNDGQSSFSTVLSNNTVTFNKEEGATEEIVSLEVYYGAEKIPCYTSLPTTNINAYPYIAYIRKRVNTLPGINIPNAAGADKVDITITNPQRSGRYYLEVIVCNADQLKAGLDGANTKVWSQNIDIGCLVVDTGIRVSLYNENYVFESSLDETKYPLEVQVSIGMATVIRADPNSGYEDDKYYYSINNGEEEQWEYDQGYYWITNPGESKDYNVTIQIFKCISGGLVEVGAPISRKISVKVLTPIYSLKSNREYLEIDVDEKDYQPIESVNGLELVTFSAYIGNTKQSIVIDNIEIEHGLDDGIISETYADGNLTLYLLEWPFDNLISKPITVKWKKGNEIYDTKTFTLKSRIAQINYEFTLPGSIKIDTAGTKTKTFDVLKNGKKLVPGASASLYSGYYVYDSAKGAVLNSADNFVLTYTINDDYSDLKLYYCNNNSIITDGKLLASFTVNYVFEGSEYELTTYKAFNKLTNNGLMEGWFYAATIEDPANGISIGDQVYPALDGKFSLSKNNNTGPLIADQVDLHINATMIKTGILNADLIKAGELKIGEKFYANADENAINPDVTIGGFTVTNSSLYNGRTSLENSQTEGIYIGTDGISLGYSSSGNGSGILLTKEGKGCLGNWNFDQTNGFTSTSEVEFISDSKTGRLNRGQTVQRISLNTDITKVSLTLSSRRDGNIETKTYTGDNLLTEQETTFTDGSTCNWWIEDKNIFEIYAGTWKTEDLDGISLEIQGFEKTIEITPTIDGNTGKAVLSTITLSKAPIINSDSRVKNNIQNINNNYEQFYDSLKPVSYAYKYDSDQKIHFGYTVQDIEEGFINQKLDSKRYAIIEDGVGEYQGLAYTEFIALNTHEIQKLKKRVSELEAQNNDLETRIAALEKIIINSN